MGYQRKENLASHFEGCSALHKPLHLLILKLKSVTLQSKKCNVTLHSPFKGECNAHCNALRQTLGIKGLDKLYRYVYNHSMDEIELTTLKCERCGHSWIPRKPEKPQTCPKCRSPYWQTKRWRGVKK